MLLLGRRGEAGEGGVVAGPSSYRSIAREGGARGLIDREGRTDVFQILVPSIFCKLLAFLLFFFVSSHKVCLRLLLSAYMWTEVNKEVPRGVYMPTAWPDRVC